ncbi:N-methyl-L-tryptophan oxidase [Aeromicrobium camelliae]|uniref:N-methyl-L-tryptophan oxidase n=1 Tax=Aeromicrobium camelliae TaxID=1538144 RepID=A0A3N6W3F0_9ACTN|nr:N-methyl-L-tryptophan oxidase [Aeromicrobium camelliae]RQN02049.1 N-methyl-L-tryptophan oxidase [Aeromicrobium camelliae]
MTTERADTIVVGAGLAGAAAAWQLSRRGREVVVLEQFGPGHARGSSHGSSRIYRRAYEDPFHVELTGRADAAWRELEDESGVTLRTRTGGLDTGDRRDPHDFAAVLAAAGVPAEVLSPGAVAERWPGLEVPSPVMFHPDAGYLDADATVRAMLATAERAGARIVANTAVRRIETGRAGARVHTDTGSWTAAHVVVAAGPWLPELLSGLPVTPPLPVLTVRQQEVFHFRQRDRSIVYPTIVHKSDVQIYGLASGADGGPEPAMKIAQFDSNTVTTASARDGVIDPRARAVVLDHVRRTFPGLEPEPFAEASCLFTMTPDEEFVMDREGAIVVASPCSGHGAKFAPLTGALIADLVQGKPPLPRFAFRT